VLALILFCAVPLSRASGAKPIKRPLDSVSMGDLKSGCCSVWRSSLPMAKLLYSGWIVAACRVGADRKCRRPIRRYERS